MMVPNLVSIEIDLVEYIYSFSFYILCVFTEFYLNSTEFYSIWNSLKTLFSYHLHMKVASVVFLLLFYPLTWGISDNTLFCCICWLIIENQSLTLLNNKQNS